MVILIALMGEDTDFYREERTAGIRFPDKPKPLLRQFAIARVAPEKIKPFLEHTIAP